MSVVFPFIFFDFLFIMLISHMRRVTGRVKDCLVQGLLIKTLPSGLGLLTSAGPSLCLLDTADHV
jgi:hypothetical protein